MANRNNKKRRKNAKLSNANATTPAPIPTTTSTVSMDDVEQIFAGKDSEELTDKLIEELVARGWEEEGLLKF